MSDHWTRNPCAVPDAEIRDQALQRQQQLTKPPGSLGRLEELAVTLASMQGRERPSVDRVRIVVFAADHGVAANGTSAFPQAVTGEMVRNFANGGAAISVLARSLDAELEVVNLGTVNDPDPMPGVVHIPIAPMTADFSREPAMTREQLEQALQAGADAISRAGETDLFVGGDMGIGNTSSAAALGCALLKREPKELVGPGTGLDDVGMANKAKIIAQSLKLYRHGFDDPIEVLRCLGGFEIAALTGSYIKAAQMGIPVLVDGYISTAAALMATRINPECSQWMMFAHASAEQGHRLMVEALAAAPLIDLGMRLGEGSGAAVTVPLLRLACDLHNGMATFEEAAVSGKEQ